jgi:hypothetical protein
VAEAEEVTTTDRTGPRRNHRAAIGTFAVLAVAGISLTATTSAAASSLTTPTVTRTWEDIVDTQAPIALSSPVVADLQGTRAAVVGDERGYLYALSLSNGAEVRGWPVRIGGGAPIQSPPSVSGTTVFVGAGSAAEPFAGGYYAVSPTGSVLWKTTVRYQPRVAATRGVVAGLTVGTLQGIKAVVAGSLGQFLESLTASSGTPLRGFPWFQADTVFSTAALADLYGNGHTEIIEGGDSTAGNAFHVPYANGGHIRVLATSGNATAKTPSGGLLCEYNTNQVVQSSPAVGPFLAGGAIGIVAGTGTYFTGATATDHLLAVNSHCGLVWSARLDGATTDSPALIDALGNGKLQVAEGTAAGSGGTVYLLNGATGQVIWQHGALGAIIGGITSVDLGGGYQDLVVPTLRGVEILDGRTGAVVTVLETTVGVQSSPLVTDDPNGLIGITVAGYKAGGTDAGGEAVVEHFVVAHSNGARATEAGSWPEFHHDPQLSGNA